MIETTALNVTLLRDTLVIATLGFLLLSLASATLPVTFHLCRRSLPLFRCFSPVVDLPRPRPSGCYTFRFPSACALEGMYQVSVPFSRRRFIFLRYDAQRCHIQRVADDCMILFHLSRCVSCMLFDNGGHLFMGSFFTFCNRRRTFNYTWVVSRFVSLSPNGAPPSIHGDRLSHCERRFTR